MSIAMGIGLYALASICGTLVALRLVAVNAPEHNDGIVTEGVSYEEN